MESFSLVLNQLLILLVFVVLGWALYKARLVPENADTAVSKIMNYAIMPAMIIKSFYSNCNVANFVNNASLMLFSVANIAVSTVVAFLLTPRLEKNKEIRGAYNYSMVVTNFGFMGYALVGGIWGEETLFSFMMFHIPTSIFIYLIGILWLTGGDKKFSLKALLNPQFICMVFSILLGFWHPTLPTFVTSSISSLASCFSSLTMLMTGFVIAKFELKKLLVNKNVYILCLVRNIIMPLCFYALIRLLKISELPALMLMITASLPLGLNPVVMAAAYGKDQTPGASMAVISNLLCIITLPLLLMLVM